MAVVVLFVVTELPQGALALCSGLVEHCFQSYYAPLGDTMDIVALVNNGINFALYCTMSARFRQTFARLISLSKPPGADRRRRRAPTPDECPAGRHGLDGPRRRLGHGELEDGYELARIQVSDECGEKATWNMTTHCPELHDQLETDVIDKRSNVKDYRKECEPESEPETGQYEPNKCVEVPIVVGLFHLY